MSVLKKLSENSKNNTCREIISLEDYINLCKKDPSVYASAPERLLKAIGKPKYIDPNTDSRSARIFQSRQVPVYEAFKDFHGLELVIEKIVGFLTHAAQGLEESKQILYLLGPVGSAKSSLVERLKELMEKEPVYVLMDKDNNLSPVYEPPYSLFSPPNAKDINIPARYLNYRMSPWAVKRLKEVNGDYSKFKVCKLYPDQLEQICITKTEPGDENNQDISCLVGKLNIRQLEYFNQDDPDAYSYSGGLCKANQGILDFVEMFKAPIKILNPLLTATQEGHYNATESIGAIGFNGIIVAHSNESEWTSFKNNKNNEAFLDRVCIIRVPYCLRINEEIKIYKKLIENSNLSKAPIAPNTLEILAKFCILTRLTPTEGVNLFTKMRVYNGESVKEEDIDAKPLKEYLDLAGIDEGFSGISTRFAYKILSKVFNYDKEEIAADPIHMFVTLGDAIAAEGYDETTKENYLLFIKEDLLNEFSYNLHKDITAAYLDSYDEYGQNLFDRYIVYADYWIQDHDYRDPDTGQLLERVELDEELSKLEKPAKISNPKEFRNEVVTFCLRHKARNNGKNPDWKSYEKLKNVIENSLFSKTEDLLPIISFTKKGNNDDQVKHERYVEHMKKLGYTKRQTERVTQWYMKKR